MHAMKRRMTLVAVIVCGFAVGMAGLLNYFKYRSTANRIVTERLVVTGRSVETVIQLALDLGLQFSDISTLPATLEREQTTDDLIQGIDIFDNAGKLIYSSDKARAGRDVPREWLEAIRSSHGGDWMAEGDTESAAGTALKNSFGVTLAHLSLRYASNRVRDANGAVARELAVNTLLVFVVSSALAALALIAVMRRLSRDLAAAEAALTASDATHDAAMAARGPFGKVIGRFVRSTREVEREIAALDAGLQQGARA